jgi:hypothetical protein
LGLGQNFFGGNQCNTKNNHSARLLAVKTIHTHAPSYSTSKRNILTYSARFFSLYSLLPHPSSFIFLLHPNKQGPHIFFIPFSPQPPPPSTSRSPLSPLSESLLFPSGASRTGADHPSLRVHTGGLPPLLLDLPVGRTGRRGRAKHGGLDLPAGAGAQAGAVARSTVAEARVGGGPRRGRQRRPT